MTVDLFSLDGRVAVVTGGTGALGSALAEGLAGAGAHVVVVARGRERVEHTVARLGPRVTGVCADVLDESSLVAARAEILERFGALHILVNCAGGNVPSATLPDGASPFDLGVDAFREVLDLNLMGTVLPVWVFAAAMESGADCSIVTISSVAATRAVTRVGGYGAAKAGVESLTRWLAVELGRRGTGIRVNAVVPGFFLGDQNRRLLVEESGDLTERGRTIVARTPLGRFGEPSELTATVVWLVSPGARFVTGVAVPVDGGFSAFSGV